MKPSPARCPCTPMSSHLQERKALSKHPCKFSHAPTPAVPGRFGCQRFAVQGTWLLQIQSKEAIGLCICVCIYVYINYIYRLSFDKKTKYYLLEHSLTWNSSRFLFYILLDHSGVLWPMAVYMHSILSTRLHMPNVGWSLRLSVSQGNLWIPLIRTLILVYSNRRGKNHNQLWFLKEFLSTL